MNYDGSPTVARVTGLVDDGGAFTGDLMRARVDDRDAERVEGVLHLRYIPARDYVQSCDPRRSVPDAPAGGHLVLPLLRLLPVHGARTERSLQRVLAAVPLPGVGGDPVPCHASVGGRSRTDGAHVWVFFDDQVAAARVRSMARLFDMWTA